MISRRDVNVEIIRLNVGFVTDRANQQNVFRQFFHRHPVLVAAEMLQKIRI
jgi:hypothetical protein